MEVVKWLKYIVKKGICTQEILLSLSLSLRPTILLLSLRAALQQPHLFRVPETVCTRFFLFHLLHNLPKLEILYYDATTTSITEGRQNEVPSESVCKVCH
jgi:hypothetical protein